MAKILAGSADLQQLSATPSTPASGYQKFYFKTDNRAYTKDPSGAEQLIGPLTIGTGLALTGQTVSIATSGVTSNMINDGEIQLADLNASLKDGTPASAQVRSLGSGTNQACQGTDPRLSDQRIPQDGTVSFAKLGTTLQQSIALPGMMMLWAGTQAAIPTGWIQCNGGTWSRTSFSALYTALGGASSPYGQGDGTTTFNVPNFNNAFAMGSATTASGVTGGANSYQLSEAQMANHTHSTPNHNHTFDKSNTAGSTTGTYMAGSSTINLNGAGIFNPTTSGGGTTGGGTGVGASVDNRPAFVTLFYIIKA